MDSSPGFLMIDFGHSILWYILLKYQQFFPEVSFWAPVYFGCNNQLRHQEVEGWFGSG